MASLLAEHIHAVSGTRIGLDTSFFTAGLNSAALAAVHSRLCDLFPGLRITEMFKYPTRRSLARFLAGTGGSTAADVPGAAPEGWSTPADSPNSRRDLRAQIRQRDSADR